MPYVLATSRQRHRRPQYGKDPLTGQDRVALKDPYGSSVPYFTQPLRRRMRVTTGSKMWGIAEGIDTGSHRNDESGLAIRLRGQRRGDDAFFAPPNPGKMVVSVAAPPMKPKPEKPKSAKSSKSRIVSRGKIRNALVKPKCAKHESKAKSPVVLCLPCGSMPPASMTKCAHLLYGNLTFLSIQNRNFQLYSSSKQDRAQQQLHHGFEKGSPDEPKRHFEAFSAMSRGEIGRRRADIRIPGSSSDEKEVGVPTIGPAVTYVTPPAAARIDGTQIVSPKVDLGSPSHDIDAEVGPDTTMTRIVQGQAAKFFVNSNGEEEAQDFVPQNMRAPRSGKQGLWPKDGEYLNLTPDVRKLETHSQDGSSVVQENDNMRDTETLDSNNTRIMPSKRCVSVKNLIATDVVAQISSVSSYNEISNRMNHPEHPPSVLEAPIVRIDNRSAYPPNSDNLTRRYSNDSDSEDEEEKVQMMLTPAVTVRRGNQQIRKVATMVYEGTSDGGNIFGEQLLETASGRIRVSQEGDSAVQDVDSILDLDDNRSFVSQAYSIETQDRNTIRDKTKPRPVTRELTCAPIVTIEASMKPGAPEVHSPSSGPSSRPIPSTRIPRR